MKGIFEFIGKVNFRNSVLNGFMKVTLQIYREKDNEAFKTGKN